MNEQQCAPPRLTLVQPSERGGFCHSSAVSLSVLQYLNSPLRGVDIYLKFLN